MTTEISDIATLRTALTDLKREAAKVIAAMQLGGDRAKRRELSRRLANCRKRARALTAPANALLASSSRETERAELEQALRFLSQMQSMGTEPAGALKASDRLR